MGVSSRLFSRVVAGIGLALAGALTIFVAPFMFIPLGPFILVVIAVGAFQLLEAIRLIRSSPTGRTLAAIAVALLGAFWAATNDGDGPALLPWRPIAFAVLATNLVAGWVVIREGSSATP